MNKKSYKLIKQILYSTVIIFAVFTVKSSAQTQPPDFTWALNQGGGGYDMASDVAVDLNGDLVVAGYFDSTVTFGTTTLQSAGSSDIYIAKYTSDGGVIWAVSAGGTSYDVPYSITTDRLGNIIVTGIFSGTAIFETTTLNSVGNYDIFVAKYNSNGALQWVQQAGGQNYDYGYGVTTDNLNNIIVTGDYQQFATFGSFTLQSGNPYGDIFVAKYNSLGTVQWATNAYDQTGGQSFYNYSYGAATDLSNNVYITGSFGGSISFGTINLVSSFDGTNEDVFLAKYNSAGSVQWVEQAGSDSSNVFSFGNDVLVDNNGDVFITGQFNTQINFGFISLSASSSADIFIAKYDEQGNINWAQKDNISLYYNTGVGLAVDNADNISLIGNVSQDQSGGELSDVYFARYRSSGEKLWGVRAGILNSASAGGIANDSKGDIYGSGDFYQSGQFGTITLNGLNGEAFLGKIPSPKFTLTPDSVDFGQQPLFYIGSAYVSITNTSGANLHIYSIIPVQDTSGTIFIADSPDSVEALSSTNITVGFVPVYEGFKDAVFEINSDASTSPDTFYVRGTGITPDISISDSILDFGSVDVGITSSLNLSIINPTISDIVIDSITISGINSSLFTYTPAIRNDTLRLFGFRNLTVNFTPDSSGLKNAQLVVYSSSGSSPDTVLLTGNGLSVIQVQLPSSPNIGQSTPLTISPPSASLFTTKDIYYRIAGDTTYQQDTLTTVGLNYTYNIPQQYSTVRGIQFYVLFSDGLTTITYPSVNPELNPASIDVSIPQINFPNLIQTSRYQMISIPLSINASSIDSVFTDDYGPYDDKVWRIFRYDPLVSDYAEYHAITGNVVPGNAFWLIDKNGQTFDVDNAQSVSTFNSYTVSIQPGYNQVGDPFAFPINWLQVGNSDLLLQAPIHWNADSSKYELDQAVIQPWEGYWVYNPLNQVINLDVNPNPSLGKKQNADRFASMKSDEFLGTGKSRFRIGRK